MAPMNPDASFHLMTSDPPSVLAELAAVALGSEVTTDDGRVLGAGACGTIVGVWGNGTAYDVEFIEPFAALGTVGAEAIRPDARTHG